MATTVDHSWCSPGLSTQGGQLNLITGQVM